MRSVQAVPMRKGRYRVALFLLLFTALVGGCNGFRNTDLRDDGQGSAAATAPVSLLPSAAPPTQPGEVPDEITLRISLYRLVALRPDGSQHPALSSARTDEELRVILDGMNGIWAQGSVAFEAGYVGPLAVPEDIALGIARGNFGPFFAALGQTIILPEPSTINGLYATYIGGPNGIAPSGTQLYFVTDEPSVFDRRVSSHEVGHILGLGHILSDPNHLMSPGTNGMRLENWEISTAREYAPLLD